MTPIEWINAGIVVIGLPTIIGVAIKLGGKLNVLDTIESDLKENIRPDLKDIRERFSNLEGKMSGTMQTNSPISLTPIGEKNLDQSGLKLYIDDHVDEFLLSCEKTKNLSNPYDIQKSIFEFFDEYSFPTSFENELKNYSFNQGLDFSILKRIGAIYFRDIVLKQKGFSEGDLDSQKGN